MAEQVRTQDFAANVLSSPVPVLVDFYATWCGPCRMQGPILDELGHESEGAYRVVKVDVDSDPDLATKYNVTVLPTLMIFQDGQVVERLIGLQQKDPLKRSLLASAT